VNSRTARSISASLGLPREFAVGPVGSLMTEAEGSRWPVNANAKLPGVDEARSFFALAIRLIRALKVRTIQDGQSDSLIRVARDYVPQRPVQKHCERETS